MLTLAYLLLWAATIASVAHLRYSKRWIGWAAIGATIASWGALTLGLVTRGLNAGHWPLTNRYEFALCFMWAIVSIYMLLETSWRERRRTEAFVLAIALLVATYAMLRPADEQTIQPLLPALRSVWLQIHVLSAAVGYGACAVAAGLGAIQFMPSRSFVQEQLPRREEIERVMERILELGFLWLTASILSGAIWAQNVWGRYWGWDPKETWTLIAWLWYLLVLHVRGLRGWYGRRLAVLVIVGLAVVFFTFAGLPWWLQTTRLESLHGF